MINIAELLKNAPKGMSLYSTLFGNVELSEVRIGDDMPIRIKRGYAVELFDEYGRYYKGFPDAECLLFPSKDCRTWEGWTVEPKFKVGDWAIDKYVTDCVFQITKILDDSYEITEKDGHVTSCLQCDIEDNSRLWTIADAKDGDVLACSDWLFILKQFNVKGNNHKTYCHYDLTLNRFKDDTDSYMVSGSDEFHPANKLQRDLLFAKMREAGYKWDAGKKELRKIIEPKFKVGDEIFSRHARNEYFKIKGIEKDNDTVWYVTTRTRIADNDKRIGEIVSINAFYQNEYSIAPKTHYDIANFHAGMPVLVRETSLNAWQYVLFSHCYIGGDGLTRFNAGLVGFTQCIPFNEETKHLLGTTDMCPKEYINW